MDIFTRIIFWQIWGGMQLNIRRILFEAKRKFLFCMIRPSFLKRKEKVYLVIVNYCICYVLYQWKSISLPEPWSYSYEQEWLQTIWGSTSWSPRVWDRVWGWSTPEGYGEESAWNQCYSWKVNNKPRTILHDIIHSIMIGLELLQGKSGKLDWRLAGFYQLRGWDIIFIFTQGMHSVDGFHWGAACSRPFVNETGWQ